MQPNPPPQFIESNYGTYLQNGSQLPPPPPPTQHSQYSYTSPGGEASFFGANQQMQFTFTSTVAVPQQPHTLVWVLTEQYIDRAKALCFISSTQPNAQAGWRQQHRELIRAAIQCLVGVIASDLAAMTQLDKAKSRLRLAQILFEETENIDRAEEEVNRAIIATDTIQGFSARDVQLRLYDLQCQIFIKTKKYRQAKNTIKLASEEAQRQDLIHWVYQFTLLKAQVLSLTNDVPGCLTTLNQKATLAETRGDFELMCAFWLVAGHYAMTSSHWDQAAYYLKRVSPHMSGGSTSAPTPASTDIPVIVGSPLANARQCATKQFRVFYLLLYITNALRTGQMEQVQTSLKELHCALDDTRPRNVQELQGIFCIPLGAMTNSGSAAFPISVDIRWMSFSQVYCLTYLLSGICSKTDQTQPLKAQQFLVEGIKVVDRELNTMDFAPSSMHVQRNQQWFAVLMMNMLLHLFDVFLLKFDLASAEQTILKAAYWAEVCNVWGLFKVKLSLSIGMLLQMSSRLDEALEWYSLCRVQVIDCEQDPDNYDSVSVAILNTALIHCGDLRFDLAKVKALRTEVRSRYPSGMSPSIQCSMHLIESWVTEGALPARQHLQESLRLSSMLQNTQLRSTTLLLLGNVYLQTHDDQAEKMLAAGHAHAFKSGGHIVAGAAGSCLQDLYLQASKGIKAKQQTALNKKALAIVDHAFSTEFLAPLLKDGQLPPTNSTR